MNNENIVPTGELTDEDIYDCLPLGVAEFSVICGPSEISAFARAIIKADRALCASSACTGPVARVCHPRPNCLTTILKP